MTSDRFATLWDDANRIAHSQIVDVLDAEKAPRGAVVIDLSGVAKAATDRLGSAGVHFFDRFDVGNRNLEFTVFQSDEIAKVQDSFRLFDKVATVMPWIAILLLVGAVFVFPNRRRGVIWAASGLAIGAFFVLLALTIGRSIYLSALPRSVSQPAAEAAFDTLVRFVRPGTRTVVAVGLVVLSSPWWRSPRAGGRRLRAACSTRHRTASATRPTSTAPTSDRSASFVSHNLNALRIAVAVIAGIVFIAWSRPDRHDRAVDRDRVRSRPAVLEVLARIGAVGRRRARDPNRRQPRNLRAAGHRTTPPPHRPDGSSGNRLVPRSGTSGGYVDDLDYRPFDADNHYYEALDAFTRHLDPAHGRPVRSVVRDRWSELPRARWAGLPRRGEPHVRSGGAPRGDARLLPRQPRREEPVVVPVRT